MCTRAQNFVDSLPKVVAVLAACALSLSACVGDDGTGGTSDSGGSDTLDVSDAGSDADTLNAGSDTADSDSSGWPDGFERRATTLAAGLGHTCHIKGDNTVDCWGLGWDPDREEATGDGDQAVPPAGEFVQLTAGFFHTCGIRTDKTIDCWGLGSDPVSLEDETRDHNQSIPPESEFELIDAGSLQSCGIRIDGTVDCWGADQIEAGLDGQYIGISVGREHLCAIDSDGALECFGVGSDPDQDEGEGDFDQAVAPDGEFIQVSAGSFHSCGIRPDYTLECWGLGDAPGRDPSAGDFDQTGPPLGEFDQVVAGRLHTCALTRDSGEVLCWGNGSPEFEENLEHFGQAESRSDKEYVEVAAGPLHTCARGVDGLVECWGWNGLGQSEQDSEFGADGCEMTDWNTFDRFACSPLCQTGCADGEMCVLRRSDSGAITTCLPAGDREEGESCNVFEDEFCEAGTDCVRDDTGPFCRSICRTDRQGNCPAGTSCQGWGREIGWCEPVTQ